MELVGIAKLAASGGLLAAKRTVEYFELPTRHLLNRTSERMPFQWTINPYRGCEFGCVYCYARYTHEFLELDAVHAFERKIFAKRFLAAGLAGELRKIGRKDWIAIGTATDPYQPAERRFEVTREILKVFAAGRGRRLSVTTKSDLVLRDVELLREIARANILHVNFTLTTMDESLARLLEPRATRPERRIASARGLAEAGIQVGVFSNPILPLLTDSEESLDAVAGAAAEAGATFLGSGLLFLKPCASRFSCRSSSATSPAWRPNTKGSTGPARSSAARTPNGSASGCSASAPATGSAMRPSSTHRSCGNPSRSRAACSRRRAPCDHLNVPELPEVETVVRTVAPHLVGRQISRARFYSRLVLRSDAARTAARLRGQRIETVRRHGKFILMELSGGLTLAIHLGMTGGLLWNAEPGPHARAVFDLDRGRLVYDDPRQFGRIELGNSLPERAARLGPDALAVGAEEFAARLTARRGRIKPLLLNQVFLRGLGNIYADESLFGARIHPLASVARLSPARVGRLYAAIQEVLRAAVEAGGSSVSDYVDADGRAGNFQVQHQVYGREGAPCPRCGTPIRRIVVGQRGTHYCPQCQRA